MDVKDRVLELLDKDFEKDKCIQVLKKEFPWVNRKYLKSTWRQAKKEWCAAKHTDYLAVPYVGAGRSKKELERLGEIEMTKKESEKSSKLQVVRKEIEILGEYGSYLITEKGVKAGEEEFKNLEDLKIYEEKEIMEFTKRMTELKAVFKYV